jgi:tetratricopeptide (TPR) repeat protein
LATRTLKVFVSSPGDLAPERALVAHIVRAINADFLNVLQLDVILWEAKSYSARDSFQAQILDPSMCDLVIALLFQRMGTPLPIELAARADGSGYESGTAYEIESSLAHEKIHGRPQLYLFKKESNQAGVAVDALQSEALQAFWQRNFVSADGKILRAFQNFQSADDLAPQLDRGIRGWLAEQGFLKDAPRWNDAVLGSPFRGLEAFDEIHAGVFFGRNAAIEQALQRLLQAQFLLILGASGSGKSSLCKAGVVPRFREHANAKVPNCARVMHLRAGPKLVENLLQSLQTCLPDIGASFDAPQLQRALVAHQKTKAHTPTLIDASPQYLLVIDQFEEAFAQSMAEIEAFAAQLSLLLDAGFFVLASMRADCYGELVQIPHLSALKDRGASLDLRAPGVAEFEEMIRAPAAAAKLGFERNDQNVDVAQQMLADLKGSDALALMQLCLARMYAERSGQTLSFVSYHAMGGVQGAIAAVAESAYLRLSEATQAALPSVLSELVSEFSDSGEVLCKVIPLHVEQESDQRREFIHQYSEARLLIKEGATVRVAHEALVRAWPRAVEALDAIRDVLQLRARLIAPLKEWQEDANALLAPQPLLFAAVETLQGGNAKLLSSSEQAFITASNAAIQRARSKRLRMITGVAAALALSAILAGFMAWRATQATARATASFAASVDGINTLTRDLAQSLRQSKGVRAETVESVLQKAQTMVNRIDSTDPGNLDLELARISMLIAFSDTYRTVARSREANAALHQVKTRLEKLQGSKQNQSNRTRIQRLRAEYHISQATQAETHLDLDEALAHAKSALAHANDDPLRLRAHVRIAKALLLQNQLPGVVEEFQQAQQLPVDQADAEIKALQLEFAAIQLEALNGLGKFDHAKQLQTKTLEQLNSALSMDPNSADLQEIALRLKRQEANDFLKSNQIERAKQVLDQAIDQVRVAIKENANHAKLRLAAKRLLNLRAQIFRRSVDADAELSDLRESLKVLAEISTRDPDQLFMRAEVSFAHRRLSEAFWFYADQQEDDPRAVEFFHKAEPDALAAVEIDRALLKLSPKRVNARRYLSASLEHLGAARHRTNQPDLALVSYQESLAIREELAREFPNEPIWHKLCGYSWSSIKDVHTLQFQQEPAINAQRKATEAFKVALDISPSDESRLLWFDSALRMVEVIKVATIKPPNGRDEAERLLEHLRNVALSHATDFAKRNDLLIELNRIEALKYR